jgi:hypothetical protein
MAGFLQIGGETPHWAVPFPIIDIGLSKRDARDVRQKFKAR